MFQERERKNTSLMYYCYRRKRDEITKCQCIYKTRRLLRVSLKRILMFEDNGSHPSLTLLSFNKQGVTLSLFVGSPVINA